MSFATNSVDLYVSILSIGFSEAHASLYAHSLIDFPGRNVLYRAGARLDSGLGRPAYSKQNYRNALGFHSMMESRYIKTGFAAVAVVSSTVVLLYIVMLSRAASLRGGSVFPNLTDVEHNKSHTVEITDNKVIINVIISDKRTVCVGFTSTNNEVFSVY